MTWLHNYFLNICDEYIIAALDNYIKLTRANLWLISINVFWLKNSKNWQKLSIASEHRLTLLFKIKCSATLNNGPDRAIKQVLCLQLLCTK